MLNFVGYGVFAKRLVEPGEFIMEYKGMCSFILDQMLDPGTTNLFKV